MYGYYYDRYVDMLRMWITIMSCFYVLSLNVFTHNKGWAEPFFPTPMSKPPGGPGGPTHPPSKP